MLPGDKAGTRCSDICGGYQMLAAEIDDLVESAAGRVEGLGCCPRRSTSLPPRCWLDQADAGGATRCGRTRSTMASPGCAVEAEPFLDGCRVGQVWGTMWHGTLENDGFRRAWLAEVAAASGSSWQPQADAPSFAGPAGGDDRSARDAIEKHVDVDLIVGGHR